MILTLVLKTTNLYGLAIDILYEYKDYKFNFSYYKIFNPF